jgi:hypothetical protein
MARAVLTARDVFWHVGTAMKLLVECTPIFQERRMLARHADCDGRVLTVVAIADGEVAGVMERASN